MERKGIIKIIVFMIVSGIILLVFYHCPFLHIFGIPCPGCGMTRALISAVRLDFKEAFHYHPLFPIVIVWAVYMLLKHMGKIKVSKKTENRLLLAVCILFITVYIIRFLTGSDIVAADFKNSVIYRILSINI